MNRPSASAIANIIAVAALGISIWSALYAHRLGKFSESTYAEEKRSAIRLSAYDFGVIEKDFLEDVENFLSNSDYEFKTEDAIRLGKLRDDLNSLIESTKKLQSGIDKDDLANDPRFANYYVSTLEEYRRRLERNKKQFADLKAELSKEQKPSPSPTPTPH